MDAELAREIEMKLAKEMGELSDELRETLMDNLESYHQDEIKKRIDFIVFSSCRAKIDEFKQQVSTIVSEARLECEALIRQVDEKKQQLAELDAAIDDRLSQLSEVAYAIPKKRMSAEEAYNYAVSQGYSSSKTVQIFVNWAKENKTRSVKEYGIRVLPGGVDTDDLQFELVKKPES